MLGYFVLVVIIILLFRRLEILFVSMEKAVFCTAFLFYIIILTFAKCLTIKTN